ncbi:MAG: 3-methyl-2-oxobutanoate hydroxymethyltransferase [Deltaproteobacteria bacterium]|nr:3-methyl-2-oxobutanoate hydroxymethyltransferase [Deltaproteobacteria bacterium]
MGTTKKITVPQLLSRKHKGRKIVMVTAYDATFARLVDQGGADMVLVGDSLGMVVQGHDNTLPVTLDDIVYHCRAVSRGLARAHLCADMPFMSYKISAEQALASAARVVQDGRAESVKLEGGVEIAETVSRLVRAGIPVVGHVGLTPQSVHALGGFRMQGRTGFDRERLIEDARAVADAGAFCLVLESMPLELAQAITDEVSVPTIGIGAGPHCDGQVLVIYDLLGLDESFSPRFLKRYAHLGASVREAVASYADEVRRSAFPGPEHSTSVADGEPGDGGLYGGANKDVSH